MKLYIFLILGFITFVLLILTSCLLGNHSKGSEWLSFLFISLFIGFIYTSIRFNKKLNQFFFLVPPILFLILSYFLNFMLVQNSSKYSFSLIFMFFLITYKILIIYISTPTKNLK
jgi:hypothetical protein